MELDAAKKIYAANYKKVTLKTMDGETIFGKINLSSKQRVSDLFTKGDQGFIVLVDAVSKEVTGKTLFINKDHIVWAEPEE